MENTALDTLSRVSSLIKQGMTDGLHVGAQVYASLHGKIVADAAWGLAREGVPMRTDTLMLWMSSGKPVTAVATGQMWERGKIDLDDRVTHYVPEFGAGGKEEITIRHLLIHTGGFRGAAMNFTPEPWDETIAKICAARLESDWIPGKKAGYHIAGSWFILGEIVRRIDGRPFDQYLREEILLPLGMENSWVGMPSDRYRAYGDRIGWMHNTSEPESARDFKADSEAGAGVCSPGANSRGPVRELGFFYEAMIGQGSRNGRKILSPQTVAAMTACHRRGMLDHTFSRVMDWGLGIIVNNNLHGGDAVPYSFGRHASPRAFGHGGYQSSVGFGDPEFGLAAAILFNGCPGELKHHLRLRQVTAALYEDLGLAPA